MEFKKCRFYRKLFQNRFFIKSSVSLSNINGVSKENDAMNKMT